MKRKYFIIAFILITPVGTITHELGHLFVAKNLGYNTVLHHSSLSWNNELLKSLKNQYEKFELQIENDLPFKGKREYNINIKTLNKHRLLIVFGGVALTLIFSSIAFILLLYRIIIKKKKFTSFDWLLSFVSLFWIREPANLILSIVKGIKLNNDIYFYGDDAKMAKLLGLHEGAILIPLSIIAILISLMILKTIPNRRKKEFVIAGLIGCPIGFILWVFVIGPIILP